LNSQSRHLRDRGQCRRGDDLRGSKPRFRPLIGEAGFSFEGGLGYHQRSIRHLNNVIEQWVSSEPGYSCPRRASGMRRRPATVPRYRSGSASQQQSCASFQNGQCQLPKPTEVQGESRDRSMLRTSQYRCVAVNADGTYVKTSNRLSANNLQLARYLT